MKRRPFKTQGVSSFLTVFAFYTVSICIIPDVDAAAKVQRNLKNFTYQSSESPDTFMTGEAGSREEILVDVGDTVYIGCASNRTNAYGCEWYKWAPQGGKKRITQFVGRYQKIDACQLQIRSVTYDDGGSLICKIMTDSSEPTFHVKQLTVTGQDDPTGNILLKPDTDVSKPRLPYTEPEIMIEPFSENQQYHKHNGGNLRLKCEATGNPKPLVSWRRGSRNYTGFTEGYSYLEITNLTNGDTGPYRCEAVNIFGKVVHDVHLEVKGALQGASEIIDVTPRNITLYEGSHGNITCIARFEGDPWFGWVKKIDHLTPDIKPSFSYEGQHYSVLNRTEIRPLGQHLFSTTLLLQNVTVESSGVYHCIVAGLQGFNHSEAYLMVEKDPASLHIAQLRKHKYIAILWIFSFVIFAGLVVLCIVRIYGCPNMAANKILSSQTSLPSATTSSRKTTQLPKRSPETLSTDCTNAQHEAFAPLMTHGSCSLASQDASLFLKTYSPSCRTYNSYDPECSYACSSPDSVLMANLEAARSSNSHIVASCDSENCSEQSVPSPRTQTSDYYTSSQLKMHDGGYQSSQSPHLHKHQHQHHHLYPEGNVNYNYKSHYQQQQQPTIHYQPTVLDHVCSCTQEYCRCHTPSIDNDDFRQSSSNLSIFTDCDSQWQSENIKSPPPQHFRHHRHYHHSVEDDQSYSLDEDDDLQSCSRATNHRGKLNPSPTSHLSFLKPNKLQITEMRDARNKRRVPLVPFL